MKNDYILFLLFWWFLPVSKTIARNNTRESKSVLLNQTVSCPMLFTLTLITLKIKSMRVMSKLQIGIYIYV